MEILSQLWVINWRLPVVETSGGQQSIHAIGIPSNQLINLYFKNAVKNIFFFYFVRVRENLLPCIYFAFKDYSWEDHGYSLVNRLYPDVGQLIDEKFQIAYNLTYNTMAMHKDVDTSMLRRAIWNYIHCMFGIRLVRISFSYLLILEILLPILLEHILWKFILRTYIKSHEHTINELDKNLIALVTSY